MKVSELSGALLDYWVAKAEGKSAVIATREGYAPSSMDPLVCRVVGIAFTPSSTWQCGGPIIERERISVTAALGTGWPPIPPWDGYVLLSDRKHGESGSTPLEAAMRAYVAHKLGDEVPDTQLP